jgi:hypothetical protein
MQFDSSLPRYRRAHSVKRKKLGELSYRDLANRRTVIWPLVRLRSRRCPRSLQRYESSPESSPRPTVPSRPITASSRSTSTKWGGCKAAYPRHKDRHHPTTSRTSQQGVVVTDGVREEDRRRGQACCEDVLGRMKGVSMPVGQTHIGPATPMGASLVADGSTFRFWAPRAIHV